jgi:hypothetical protein
MKIASVKIRAKRIEVKRYLTRDMRAIDYGDNACLARAPNDFFNWEDNCSW